TRMVELQCLAQRRIPLVAQVVLDRGRELPATPHHVFDRLPDCVVCCGRVRVGDRAARVDLLCQEVALPCEHLELCQVVALQRLELHPQQVGVALERSDAGGRWLRPCRVRSDRRVHWSASCLPAATCFAASIPDVCSEATMLISRASRSWSSVRPIWLISEMK